MGLNFTIKLAPAKSSRVKNTTTVLERNVLAVVVFEDNQYLASINGKTYEIDPRCYNCKGVRNVYLRKNNKYIRVIRDNDSRIALPKCYTPFKANMHIKGDIIIKDKSYFKITSYIIPVDLTIEEITTSFIEDDDLNL